MGDMTAEIYTWSVDLTELNEGDTEFTIHLAQIPEGTFKITRNTNKITAF